MDDRTDFARAVEESIGPVLAAAGFALAGSTPRSARYESGDVIVSITCEYISFEIDLRIYRVDDKAGGVSLPDVLRALPGRRDRNLPLFQFGNRDSLRRNLGVMAGLLREHGGAVLRGERAAFDAIRRVGSRLDADHTKELVQSPVREEAERAWKARDFAAVRRLYGSIEADLTPVERQKWKYAQGR
jgi:hypothetical protein